MIDDIFNRVEEITLLSRRFLMGKYGLFDDHVEDEAYEILNAVLQLNTMLENARKYTVETLPRTLVHDLYNPLAVVIGYAELILNEGHLEKHQRHVMKHIQNHARIIYDLIDIVFRKKELST